jgi:L-amino acid N-acyltransferase YncA
MVAGNETERSGTKRRSQRERSGVRRGNETAFAEGTKRRSQRERSGVRRGNETAFAEGTKRRSFRTFGGAGTKRRSFRTMMEEFSIRRATREDVPAILEIYNDAVLHTTASAEYEPRALDVEYEWFDEHARDGYPIFVAVNPAGDVVGWSSLSRYKERYGYRFSVESSIYIHPQWRGQGVGKLLMPPLIDAARELGMHALIAGVTADNAVSLKLHEQFGFERVAQFREVMFKFDKWLDVIYLERLID